ncbi:12258_t:CDS:2, partial [Racocetra persica]
MITPSKSKTPSNDADTNDSIIIQNKKLRNDDSRTNAKNAEKTNKTTYKDGKAAAKHQETIIHGTKNDHTIEIEGTIKRRRYKRQHHNTNREA